MREPSQYPAWSPAMAATTHTVTTCHSSRPTEACTIAAVTSSESPGRKGKSTPDSMKTMTPMPMRTHGPRAVRRAPASETVPIRPPIQLMMSTQCSFPWHPGRVLTAASLGAGSVGPL